MAQFSQRSEAVLQTCHPRLGVLLREVVRSYDCSILPDGGARTPQRQQELVGSGASRTLDSKHVVTAEQPLSRAVDASPYPVVWPTPEMSHTAYTHAVGRFYHFAGYVKAVAERLGIAIRWGGDWDQDLDFADQTFDDLDHFELVEDV